MHKREEEENVRLVIFYQHVMSHNNMTTYKNIQFRWRKQDQNFHYCILNLIRKIYRNMTLSMYWKLQINLRPNSYSDKRLLTLYSNHIYENVINKTIMMQFWTMQEDDESKVSDKIKYMRFWLCSNFTKKP